MRKVLVGGDGRVVAVEDYVGLLLLAFGLREIDGKYGYS